MLNNILFLKNSQYCVPSHTSSKKCTVEGVIGAYITYTLSVNDSSFCFLKQIPYIKFVTIIHTSSCQQKNPKGSHNLPQQNLDVKRSRNQAWKVVLNDMDLFFRILICNMIQLDIIRCDRTPTLATPDFTPRSVNISYLAQSAGNRGPHNLRLPHKTGTNQRVHVIAIREIRSSPKCPDVTAACS